MCGVWRLHTWIGTEGLRDPSVLVLRDAGESPGARVVRGGAALCGRMTDVKG